MSTLDRYRKPGGFVQLLQLHGPGAPHGDSAASDPSRSCVVLDWRERKWNVAAAFPPLEKSLGSIGG